MDGVLTHDEASELLGAYAVDALPADEAPAVARHVAECRRCAAELASYHEVAGMLGNAGGEAPPHLWERLSAEIWGTERPAPGDGRIVELLGGRVAASPATPAQQRARARARRRMDAARRAGGRLLPGGARAWLTGAVAAALVLVGLLGYEVHHLNGRVNQLATSSQQLGVVRAAQEALMNPAAHQVSLASTTGRRATVAEIVILPSGMSYVINGSMPPLAIEKTYQLWGMVGGKLVSLGLLGNDPGAVALQLDPNGGFSEFAVTAEPAGGAVQPTTSPLADGRVA